MEDGSNDPDQKFKDTASHHYPQSYKKAQKWLDDGKKSYQGKDYKNASYCFGVASHYITDTFSASHCVDGESESDHHHYEVQAEKLTPKISIIQGDLNTVMQNGFNQGKISWGNW